MILPRGTIKLMKKGGEETITSLFSMIHNQRLTGYISVEGDHLGQIFFKDGVPKLAEVMIDNNSTRSNEAAKIILQMMLNPENNVEFHENIDPDPPMAFFRDCMIKGDRIEIDEFLINLNSGNIEMQIDPGAPPPPPEEKSEKRGFRGFIKKLLGK